MHHVFWAIKGKLAGRLDPVKRPWDLDEIKTAGFRAVISLDGPGGESGKAIVRSGDGGFEHTPSDPIRAAGIEHIKMKLEPFSGPTVQQMIQFNEQMDALGSVGAVPVLVHCNTDLGRTPPMLASRLIWLGSTTAKAIARIQKAKPRIAIRPAHMETLERFRGVRAQARRSSREKLLPRMSAGSGLILKGCAGSTSVLMRVKTGSRSRWKTRVELKRELGGWMTNPGFDPYRQDQLDIAIAVRLDEKRMKDQDIDNIAKRILDALSRRRDEKPTVPHLFEDDSQVVRLLACKEPREEMKNFVTDEVEISFRRHQPRKQMILKANRLV